MSEIKLTTGEIQTNKGVLKFELYDDDAPIAVANFKKLFSRFENLPCVILEALCCGLPVISTSVGGIAEVINETNGILVTCEDTDELVLAMQNLIDNRNVYDRRTIAENATLLFNYKTVGKEIVSSYG